MSVIPQGAAVSILGHRSSPYGRGTLTIPVTIPKTLGLVMILIRCETGSDVGVDASSLAGASFVGYDLHRAILDGADLQSAIFSSAELRSARLENANLSNAILNRANLAACLASNANFTRANLTNAMMRSGIFENADFSFADFFGAIVGGAQFSGATFYGANLRYCDGLSEANLSGAIADKSTAWPLGFDAALHGVIVESA